ncbi:MAG: hypothetical protein OXB95_01845 [Rhodobacteraceae bacterium]|nr:hypothetical protein [Paracoccaceae bacterium]
MTFWIWRPLADVAAHIRNRRMAGRIGTPLASGVQHVHHGVGNHAKVDDAGTPHAALPGKERFDDTPLSIVQVGLAAAIYGLVHFSGILGSSHDILQWIRMACREMLDQDRSAFESCSNKYRH